MRSVGQNSGYMPQLDALRAIAVILVIISHWFSSTHILNRYTSNGSLGVTLFFVLSGFLITGILLRSKIKIEAGESMKREFGIFYIRRALRIFPVYYLLILVLLVFNFAAIRESFLWHFFYASNFFFWREGAFHGQLSHFWSLSVEEQFYLFWPAVIFSVAKKYLPLTFFIGIVGATCFRYMMIIPGNDIGRILTPGSLDSFCLGGLFVYGRQFATKWYQWYYNKRGLFLLLAALLLVVVHITLFKRLDEKTMGALYFLFISMAFAIIIDRVADTVETGPFHYILSKKALLYLGKISYGIYLFHNFIPYLYGIKLPAAVGAYSMYIVQTLRFLLLIILASLSWFLFEKPVLRLKSRFEY